MLYEFHLNKKRGGKTENLERERQIDGGYHKVNWKHLTLTNFGGGMFKFRLLKVTSWPLCAQATSLSAT